MNSHFNYLVATERAADLRRRAEKTRLVAEKPAIKPNRGRTGLIARAIMRMRLRDAEGGRLRVRRA